LAYEFQGPVSLALAYNCWKFRNKIGLDVALEALSDGWRKRKFTMDDLWRYARINRVANVMRPYLETVTFS